MPNVILDSTLWEEAASEQVLDLEEPAPFDDLEAARGIFWWGLGSLLLWVLIALLAL